MSKFTSHKKVKVYRFKDIIMDGVSTWISTWQPIIMFHGLTCRNLRQAYILEVTIPCQFKTWYHHWMRVYDFDNYMVTALSSCVKWPLLTSLIACFHAYFLRTPRELGLEL